MTSANVSPRRLSPPWAKCHVFVLFFGAWRGPRVSEGGRTQQFGGVFILICDFQPLLDIGNPPQLPSALNVNLLSITIFLSCLLPPPSTPPLHLPPPSPSGHRSGCSADDLLTNHKMTSPCGGRLSLFDCCWILHSAKPSGLFLGFFFPSTAFISESFSDYSLTSSSGERNE